MKIKEFYERIIDSNANLEDFLSLLLILAAKESKINELLSVIPELKKITDKLENSNILNKYKGVLILNDKELSISKFNKLINKEMGNVMDTNKLFSSIGDIWRGKIGIGKSGGKYILYDKIKTEKNLIEFIQQYSEIPFDVIVKANKEFIEDATVDSGGFYKYTPKCSTFIKGNDTNGYLVEYCYNIINRKEGQNKIKSIETRYEEYSRDL